MIAVYIGWLRGMVWIIMSKLRSGQWWKPGHSFPQLLLHKHIFFSYFSVLSWELLSHVDIWEVAPPPPSSHYTLFGYCWATHSWHSFRGPCLLIPMAYSWPSLGCLLHVRSTPWLTGSSFLNGEGVQRVCSCHHNKWAARLPLTALLQGKGGWRVWGWEQRGVWRSAVNSATVKQQLSERGSFWGSELNRRESQHPDCHRDSSRGTEQRGVMKRGGWWVCLQNPLFLCGSTCAGVGNYRFLTQRDPHHIHSLLPHKKKLVESWNISFQFATVSVLINHKHTQMMMTRV